jgi:glutamate formiminotransferase/formiminotetrahydrofolate cyclodeaminase
MVASITYEKKGFEASREDLARIGTQAHDLMKRLRYRVDADSRAFERILEANRMPRVSEEDRRARDEAIQEATLGAIEVPLSAMRDAARALDLAGEIAVKGVPSALSDAGVAALMASAAVQGAHYNVTINLTGLTDTARADRIRDEARELMRRTTERAGEIATRIRKSLES